jgi:hypothetical protein
MFDLTPCALSPTQRVRILNCHIGLPNDTSGVPHSSSLDSSPETDFGVTPLSEQKSIAFVFGVPPPKALI